LCSCEHTWRIVCRCKRQPTARPAAIIELCCVHVNTPGAQFARGSANQPSAGGHHRVMLCSCEHTWRRNLPVKAPTRRALTAIIELCCVHVNTPEAHAGDAALGGRHHRVMLCSCEHTWGVRGHGDARRSPSVIMLCSCEHTGGIVCPWKCEPNERRRPSSSYVVFM